MNYHAYYVLYLFVYGRNENDNGYHEREHLYVNDERYDDPDSLGRICGELQWSVVDDEIQTDEHGDEAERVETQEQRAVAQSEFFQ